MSHVTLADWRRWALLDVLARPAVGAVSTQQLLIRVQDNGWDRALPSNGRWDALHRDLLALERRGFVRRLDWRPARWEATDLGCFLWRESILDNPNITPEKIA